MLLPNGKRCGSEWRVGSVRGEKGASLKVCIAGHKAGVWGDFAENIGGDLIDLGAAVKGQPLKEALKKRVRIWVSPSPHWPRRLRIAPTSVPPNRRLCIHMAAYWRICPSNASSHTLRFRHSRWPHRKRTMRSFFRTCATAN